MINMFKFINKILNRFGYIIITTLDRDRYETKIDSQSIIIENKAIEIYNINKDKDKLINLVAEKDKDILALEHKIINFQGMIEQDKITIEDLNKQTIKLGDDNADLELRIYNLDKVWKERYKEINLLRSRVKSLNDSRDNYKRKYKEVCGKIALKKACHNK